MDTSTGRIMTMREVEEIIRLHPEKSGQFVSLTEEQHELLSGKNRKERREYFRKNRKLFKGVTWKDLHS